MVGRRYYFYLLYLNATVNFVGLIPQILYKNRLGGSVSGLLLSTLVSMLFMVIFHRQMNKFPGKNISQIMYGIFPEWFRKMFLMYYLFLWYCSGLFFLVSLTKISRTFMDPNMSSLLIFILFLILVVYSATLQSESILLMLEIVVLMEVPFHLLVIGRFSTDQLLNTDFMIEAMTYILHYPNFDSLAAASFIFAGYTNILLFNEQIRPIQKKHVIVAGTIGVFVLFTTYFIPIGYSGLQGIGKEVFVWLTTADSMHFEYLFVQRMTYILLLVYIGISLMFIILSWHSSLQCLNMMIFKNGGTAKWVAISFFVVVAFFVHQYTDEINLLRFFIWLLNIRFVSDIVLIIILLRSVKSRTQA
jgi:spore germination protein KB